MSAKSKVLRRRAEDLRNVGRDECLEVVGDRLLYAADLLRRLVQEAVAEMAGQFLARGRRRTCREIVERFLQVALVDEQVIGVLQRYVGADFSQHLQRTGDVDLRLVLEETLVAGLPEARRGVHHRFGERVVGDAAI